MEDKLDLTSIFVFSFYSHIITAILVLLVFLLFYIVKIRSTLSKDSFTGQHIVITGGSSGIGKSVAVQAAKRGANVTIIARNTNKLKDAKEEITKACTSQLQRIQTISLDVSKDAEEVAKALDEVEEDSGPIFMLINCAGTSISGKIEDTTEDTYKHMMNINYYGTVFPTKAVVAKMKERGKGHIVITSSQGGMLGIFGFTAYSASKFALRGFAEALDMEVRPYGVCVTVCLPPDTDTPGFAEEQKGKPLETKLISQAAGLVSPDHVALQLLKDTVAGKFYSTVGFEGFLVTTVCAGMSPVTSLLELLTQISLMGLIRLISAFYLLSFQNIVRKCMKEKDRAKRTD